MAIAYSKLNKFKEAKKAHRRSLKIREGLAKTNQFAYNSDLAMSLNNLTLLYNQIKKSKEIYMEALKIYKELAKNNFQTYGIELAKTLVMGVALFHQTYWTASRRSAKRFFTNRFTTEVPKG